MTVFLTVCGSFIALAVFGVWLDKRPINPRGRRPPNPRPTAKPRWWLP